MIYTAELNLGQSIEVGSQGAQTRVTLRSHGAGGQQSQSSSFGTGEWTSPPSLYCEEAGALLVLETAGGRRAIRISGGGLSLLEATPELHSTSEVELRESFEHAAPARPQNTMAPMRLGDMEMKPGEMRMGNMRMSLHSEPDSEPGDAQGTPQVLEARAEVGEPVRGRFCTQCGERAQEEDRFCGSCGHRLRASS